MQIQTLRSYRAFLVPAGTPLDQVEAQADNGTLPTIRIKASSSFQAEKAAHHVTGLAVLRTERVESGVA